MEVYENGVCVRLGQNEFRGQGGEGAVYVRQNKAYKVYSDPTRALPKGKLQELLPLSRPCIVKPETLLTDKAGGAVGYTMQAIGTGIPLCQVFPKAFRDRHQFTPARALALVERLRDGVQHVHDCGILIVDLNEMNFLVTPDLRDLYFIDVDSYQTAHFGATAIMESIRDRHASRFSCETDWFSFAVVSFQVLVGIHPYKGKHPQLKTLDERMQANVSVLNKHVSIPPVCVPLSTLPPLWRDWYRAVFDDGKRVAPPNGIATALAFVPTITVAAAASGPLQMRLLHTFDGSVLEMTGDCVLTTKAVYKAGRRIGGVPNGSLSIPRLVVVPGANVPLLAFLDGGQVRLQNAQTGDDVPCTLWADDLMTTEGRLYLKQNGALLETALLPTAKNLLVSTRPAANVLEQATQLFDGVAVQNLLGAWYVSLPVRTGVCQQIRVAEWDGCRVVDARYENGVLVAVTERAGQYDRHVLRFDATGKRRDCRTTSNVESTDIDFTVLDTGVCLLLDGETLEVFGAAPGDARVTEVQDASLGGGRLLSDGAQALLARNHELFAIRMGSAP